MRFTLSTAAFPLPALGKNCRGLGRCLFGFHTPELTGSTPVAAPIGEIMPRLSRRELNRLESRFLSGLSYENRLRFVGVSSSGDPKGRKSYMKARRRVLEGIQL